MKKQLSNRKKKILDYIYIYHVYGAALSAEPHRSVNSILTENYNR